MRYALYFTPAQDDPLTVAAARWLGRDAFSGGRVAQGEEAPLSDETLREATADPRRYGFHATLKAPFELKAGCSLAALSGCTSSKSSLERHAYYFVSHRSDFVGGNFVSNRQENYRLNLPNCTDIYARGQQDRKSGMSESDARRTAEAIKQQAAQGTRTEHAFTGNASDKWDNAMENKDAVLFGNELSGAYLDGYLGVK